jgi:LysM repeat protein
MASHEATDYVIAEHDTFGALAKKFNVSIKALEDANPGVDPKKLQLKQTVHIPAGTAVAATTGPARATGDSTTTSAASGDTITYTVKAGDVLTKIATANHTTVNAIKALNGMKTATIYAGHTLKIPVARVASVETAPPSSPSAPSTPSTPSAPAAPGTAPVRTF